MARRTVTATFAGGMISDEPKPGTARYIENMVARPDGLIPIKPARTYTKSSTSVSGVNAAVTGNVIAMGWSGGGVIHPTIGLVGLLDTSRAPSPTSTATKLSSITGFGMAGRPLFGSSAIRALITDRDCFSISTTVGGTTFSDSGVFRPLVAKAVTTATGTGFATSMSRIDALDGHQWFVNTENEVLIIGKGLSTSTSYETVYRYGGATAALDATFNAGTSAMSSPGTTTGYMRASTAAVWTDEVIIHGSVVGHVSVGCYLSVAIGDALEPSVTNWHHTREFMVTATGAATGTGTAASQKVHLDRKVYLPSTALYSRCLIGNTSRLSSNQLSLTEQTQPWGDPLPTSVATGWNTDAMNPRGTGGACYHQGRLYLANGSMLRWSGTVDETLQMTATSRFSTASAVSASPTSTTGTYGVEYKHISLWSTNGELPIFPAFGGDIVGLVSMNDELLILKSDGIFRMVGNVSYDGASNALDLQVIARGVGPESKFSWAETPRGVVFVQGPRIWLYDGSELSDISQGTISQAFIENTKMHTGRMYGFEEPVTTRVASDGDSVFFTPMRHDFSTATSVSLMREDPMTFDLLKHSVHHKHLVLSLRNLTWSYVSNEGLPLPAEVLRVRSDRGGVKSSLWLGDRREILALTGAESWDGDIVFTDIKGMLQEYGPSKSSTVSQNNWNPSSLDPRPGIAVTHPLMNGFDAIRPRAALMKRTEALTYSTGATAAPDGKVVVIDAAGTFSPTGDFSPADTSPLTTVDDPEWWSDVTEQASSILNSAAAMSDSEWAPRTEQEVEGSTSTSRAVSMVDRFPLSEIETAMTSPSLYYRDKWTNATNTKMRLFILHSLGLEYEEVPNRNDR